MNQKFLPIAMMVISLGAAVVYAINKDWRRAAYWLFAACITASVTF